jgi:hypothetical protein
MLISRRDWLRTAAVIAGATARPRAAGPDPIDETMARASEVIRGYSAEGWHRTATAVDRVSADGLLALARAAGASPRLEPFDLQRVDPVAQFVEIGGRRIDGLVMFDAPFTNAGGVSGGLGAADSDRPIVVCRIPPNGEAALRPIRARDGRRAIIVATAGAHPGLCPVNAAWFAEPYGPPVLQVSSEHLDVLERAAAAGSTARVVAHATRQPATAFNVVADIPGGRADLPPVCVMTPRSGWHANASERGGGLVCWLEALRASAAARPLRTIRFVASSGHELGHLGLHAYLERNRELAHDALGWVHFGANIGASTGDVGMTVSDPALAAAAHTALGRYDLDRLRQSSAAQVAGEAATISRDGGRFVSFIGQNAWFHHPRDLWPDAVDVRTVARFARAAADLVVALANSAAA